MICEVSLSGFFRHSVEGCTTKIYDLLVGMMIVVGKEELRKREILFSEPFPPLPYLYNWNSVSRRSSSLVSRLVSSQSVHLVTVLSLPLT